MIEYVYEREKLYSTSLETEDKRIFNWEVCVSTENILKLKHIQIL